MGIIGNIVSGIIVDFKLNKALKENNLNIKEFYRINEELRVMLENRIYEHKLKNDKED